MAGSELALRSYLARLMRQSRWLWLGLSVLATSAWGCSRQVHDFLILACISLLIYVAWMSVLAVANASLAWRAGGFSRTDVDAGMQAVLNGTPTVLVCGGEACRDECGARLAVQGSDGILAFFSAGHYKLSRDFNPDDGENPHRTRFKGIDFTRLREAMVLDRDALDTLANFTSLVRHLRRQGKLFSRRRAPDESFGVSADVVVVTSAYHVQRAWAVASVVLASHGLSFIIVGVPPPEPDDSRRNELEAIACRACLETKLRCIRDFLRSFLWIFTGFEGDGLAALVHWQRYKFRKQHREEQAACGSSHNAASISTWQGPVVDDASMTVDVTALESLRRDMEDEVRSGRLPMFGICVVKDGKCLFNCSAGDASEGKPLTNATILRLHSLTKPIVNVAALLLVEDGLLQLDTKVSDCIETWIDSKVQMHACADPPRRPVTVRDLICHTGGLTYGFLEDPQEVTKQYREQAVELPYPLTEHREQKRPPCPNLLEFANRLNALPLIAQPGVEFHYSLGSDLLGCVVEQVSGRALGDFLEERIFKPLGMRDTGFEIKPSQLSRLATCYRCMPDKTLKIADYEPYCISSIDETTPYLAGKVQGKCPSGGAGLLSTADDYSRFAQCIANRGEYKGFRLLKPETFAYAVTDQLAEMGANPLSDDILVWQGHGLIGGVVTSPADNDLLPSGRNSGVGTVGWGGAAGNFWFSDSANRLSCFFYTQVLDWSFGVPTLRPDFALKVYKLFPEIRAKVDKSYDDSPRRSASGFSG